MTDPAKSHVALIGHLHEKHFGTAEAQALAKRLAEEKVRSQVEMAERFANLHMPEDIRSRARAWGMEAFCVVLWNNAFQAGWREARRVHADTQNRKEEGND